MKTVPLLFATLPLLCVTPVQAALRAGSRPTEWAASADHHKVTILREAADDQEMQLIRAAENAPPDAAALSAAMGKQGGDAKPLPKQWWNKESLGIRIPFAVTAEALQYYTDLVKTYGQQKLVRFAQPSSAFTYQAKISKPLSYEIDGKAVANVTVVTLSLSFRQNFVATVAEGFSFEKKREVVFDKEGRIVHTQGDGDVRVLVLSM